MNAGLANLATLKAWLLPASMITSADYDAQILTIGLGIAWQLEASCNRNFGRLVGDTFEITADRDHVILPRYPIEAAPVIAIRETIAGGFVDQTYADFVVDHDLKAGLIQFGSWAGSSSTRLRFTYTGGYWWNQQEEDYTPPVTPTEEDPDLSVLPEGATAVPADLLLAWRMQCEFIWTQRDKLGLNIGEKQDTVLLGALSRIKLLDGVAEQLRPYVRYALT